MPSFLDTLWKGVQQAFGGAGQAVQGAGKAISGGINAGSVGSALGQAATQKGSFFKNAGGNLLSQFGNQSGGQKPQAPMPIQPKGFAQNAGRFGGGQTPPVGGGFNQDVESAPASKGMNLMDLFKGGAGKVAGGVGMMGLGNLFAPKVEAPNFNTQAMQNYQNYNTGSLPPNVEAMINRTSQINEDQQLKQLQDVYRNARPGTDYTTDSAYQRDLANLNRSQTMNRADAQAQALMGFNQQELSRASELAQLSIAEIMYKTGMDAQEAQSIKEMFGNVGGMMVSSGLGLDQFKAS